MLGAALHHEVKADVLDVLKAAVCALSGSSKDQRLGELCDGRSFKIEFSRRDAVAGESRRLIFSV